MLITGAGSFARAFVKHLLREGEYNRICLYSRNEHNQAMFREEFEDDPRLRFFLGDIADRERLKVAMRGVKTIVHSAAQKRIESCFYNSSQVVKTNVMGTLNVIEIAAEAGVCKMVTLSSDKATNPISIYGTSKLMAESLTLSANHTYGESGPRYMSVRYGNIMNSAGSVIPRWKKSLEEGKKIFITDPNATRFAMMQEEAVSLVISTLANGSTKEPTIPDLPAYRLGDLARAMGIERLIKIGLPDYEKLHESLDGETDSSQARRLSINELREMIKSI